MKNTQQADTSLTREVNFRLSKWIVTNIEQILEPDEIEEIWTELLSFYAPLTASVENVCGTMSGNGLGKYKHPPTLGSHNEDSQIGGEAGDQNA